MSVIENAEKENNMPAATAPMRHPPPRALAQRLPQKPAHLRVHNPNILHYDVPRRVVNTSKLCNSATQLAHATNR